MGQWEIIYFFFCSLYVAGFYGHQHLFLQFYLPYVLGIVFASKVKNLLGKKMSKPIL